jgi:hypothetical protein
LFFLIRLNDKNLLPISHTCFFRLDLPEYESS